MFGNRRISGHRITEEVALDAIELSDESFRISSADISQSALSENCEHSDDFRSPTEHNSCPALAQSIDAIGLINIPTLRRSGDKYIVVCGFRRVHAMKLIGMTQTESTVINDDNHRCALLAIADNAFTRQLNVMEQSRGVSLLRKFLSVEEIASSSLSIFNSPMSVAMVKMLEDISQMAGSIHHLIDHERIAMGPALRLKPYDKETIRSFITLFSKIRTGLNKQKEIITHIHEIAAREGISISDIIESDDIRAILDNSGSDMDDNRKGNLVRSLLLKRRYPHLTEAKESFAINSKRLNLKEELRLDPPVDFEGRDYTFTFKFSTVEELAARVALLSSVSQNPLIGQML